MSFARSILVSDWATENQPVVHESDEVYWGTSRKEEEWLNMPRKLFCKCGHVSEGEIQELIRLPRAKGWGYVNNNFTDKDGRIIKKWEQPPLAEDFDPKKDNHLLRANFVCPECREAPDVVLDWNMHKSFIEYDFVRVFDNRNREENNHTICLSIGTTEYYFNRNAEKLGCTTKLVRLTHNVNTGMTFAIKAKGKRALTNCSYGMYPYWIINQINHACHYESDKVKEFMGLLIGARLQWIKLEDILADTRVGLYNHLVQVMTLCALPQLQCLPFRQYSFTDTKDRTLIRKAGFNGKALMMLLAGNASKQVRKYITNENKLYNYLRYSSIFKDQNNLMKLLIAEEYNNENRYGGSHSVYGLAKNFARDNNLGGRTSLRQRQVYQFMMNIHRDEAHFVQALLKIKQRIFGRYAEPIPPDYDGDELVARPVRQTERYGYEFTIHHAWYTVQDSVRMLEDILMRDTTYKWEYDGDLQKFHDTLSRDLERYRNPYREIPYSEEEIEVYNRTIKGYTFRLAESNHELTKVGSEQNICVGGYGNRAIEKQCVIVLVTNKQGEHRLTIELNRGGWRYTDDSIVRINQAKLKRNDRPGPDEAEIVAEWCYETNTRWEDCSDMQAAKGCEWPEIPTGVAPVWVKSEQQEREQQYRELSSRQRAQQIMGIEIEPAPQWEQPRFINGQNNQGPRQQQPLPEPVYAGDLNGFPF